MNWKIPLWTAGIGITICIVAIDNAKDHSPIGSNRNCHEALQGTFQRVQVEPG